MTRRFRGGSDRKFGFHLKKHAAVLLVYTVILTVAFAAYLSGCSKTGEVSESEGFAFNERDQILKIASLINSQRLQDDVLYLCDPRFEGRPAGSEQEKEIASFIEARFKEIGLETFSDIGLETYRMDFQFPAEGAFVLTPEEVTALESVNVIGAIRGSSSQIIILTTHFDYRGIDPETNLPFPGADNNASGVAAVLEMARAIKDSGLTPYYTIVFACLSANETLFYGARNLADSIESYGLNDKVMIVNCQELGYGEISFLNLWDLNYKRNSFIVDCFRYASDVLNIDLMVSGSNSETSAYLFFIYHLPAVNCSWALSEEWPNPHTQTVEDLPETLDYTMLGAASRIIAGSVWVAANNERID